MTTNREDNQLRIAIPSKGALEKSTSELLAASGLKVSRPNDRQYVGHIPTFPGVEVIFQRASDIVTKVQEGSVDLGITGYDVFAEESIGYQHLSAIYPQLGFGRCELVLAVPDSWIDIVTMADLADLTLDFRQHKRRNLRLVTKYPNLTRKWLHQHQIVHFTLVDANGALEAAPKMGYADMIADVSSTGTTLRENRLRPIAGPPMLKSQACMIANMDLLRADSHKQQLTQLILDSIEAYLEAKNYTSITANMPGASADDLGRKLMASSELAGLHGPTVAKVYTQSAESWYAVTVVVRESNWRQAVSHLRSLGGTDITVFAPKYIFGSESYHSRQLTTQLGSPDGKLDHCADHGSTKDSD
jgi:ATP phosphoribosyltransferase